MLLVAIVMATILSLFLAMAIRPVRTSHQRLLERDLIYRGEHIATGIRRYYLQHGRFPFSLEELIENEPRLVRRLYTDPMTTDGSWTLVYLVPGDRNAMTGLNALADMINGAQRQEELNSGNISERSPGLGANQNSVFQISDRQITGIRSRSDEEGLTVRDDSRIYADWLFSALPRREADKETIQREMQRYLNRGR
jgi:hypothetical protein